MYFLFNPFICTPLKLFYSEALTGWNSASWGKTLSTKANVPNAGTYYSWRNEIWRDEKIFSLQNNQVTYQFSQTKPVIKYRRKIKDQFSFCSDSLYRTRANKLLSIYSLIRDIIQTYDFLVKPNILFSMRIQTEPLFTHLLTLYRDIKTWDPRATSHPPKLWLCPHQSFSNNAPMCNF